MGQQGNDENIDIREFHEIKFPVKIKHIKEKKFKKDKEIRLIKSGPEFCFCLTGLRIY